MDLPYDCKSFRRSSILPCSLKRIILQNNSFYTITIIPDKKLIIINNTKLKV